MRLAVQSAGFRPCKRCRPNQTSLAEQHAAEIARACRHIESSDTIPALDELAKTAGMSSYHFHRVFKSIVGLTPRAYATAIRRQRVRANLKSSRTVTEAIYESGFNSNGRFYGTELLGMNASTFRDGGAGLTIRFATGDCYLGAILV